MGITVSIIASNGLRYLQQVEQRGGEDDDSDAEVDESNDTWTDLPEANEPVSPNPVPMDQPECVEQPEPMDQPESADQPQPMDQPESADQPEPANQPEPADQPESADQPEPMDQPESMDQARHLSRSVQANTLWCSFVMHANLIANLLL